MASTKDKKERKEKKEKRTDEEGNKVRKEKKDKKEKKEKKRKSDGVLDLLENGLAAVDRMDVDGDSDGEEKVNGVNIVQGALVPFANPLADEKATKKVYKSVKKATKHKALRRGVKEVVKSLRKSPTSAPSSASDSSPLAIVIIAADISPMDVISHIPVLCEDHNIPYIYVSSRAELGAAGNTKRPTSVVMLMREAKEDQEEWNAVYAELTKLVVKAGKSVKI